MAGHPLLGTWRLVSCVREILESGEKIRPFGDNPGGLIGYHADGRMYVILTHELGGRDDGGPPPDKTGPRRDVIAYAGSYWLEDGTFDRGPPFGEQSGKGSGHDMAQPAFQEAIRQGICHFTGPPYIELFGDTAIVTSYLQILAPDPSASEFTLSSHGTGKGFRIHRVTASRWDLVRTEQGWRVKRRALRPMQTPEARELLRGVAERWMKKQEAAS